MKFNVKEVVVRDLDDKIMANNLAKDLGNVLYVKTTTLDWLDKAKAIHKGEIVELSNRETEELLVVIKHPACDLRVSEKVALMDYLNKNTIEVSSDVEELTS